MKKAAIYTINQYYDSAVEGAAPTTLLGAAVSLDGTKLTVNINNAVPAKYKRVSILYYNRLDIAEKSATVYDLEYYQFEDTDTDAGVTSHEYSLKALLSNTISSEIVGYGSVEAQILTSELNPGAIASTTTYGRKVLTFPYILNYAYSNKNMKSDGLYRYGVLDIPEYNLYTLPTGTKYLKNSLCFGESGTLYKALSDTIADPDSSSDWKTATHLDVYNEASVYQNSTSHYAMASINNVLITKYAKEQCLNTAIEQMWFDEDSNTMLDVALRIRYLMELASYYARLGSDINTLLAMNELYSVYLETVNSNRNNPVKA